jgi:dynactin complex subunit
MSMSHIRLYDLFRKELHLPDDKASDFVVAVGEVSVWEADKNRQLLATKNDVHSLKEDIYSFSSAITEDVHSLRSELKEDIHSLRSELKEDIHSLRSELKEDIHSLRSELKEDINLLRLELKENINGLRSELKEEITSSRFESKNDIHLLELKVRQFKDDIHKAIYWTGVAQFIAIISAVLAIVKFMR